jgi:predicted DNA-binding transcriptional regulator YafY
MTLLDKERVGAQELADMFEVSARTIYRDIDTINMAGIPVHSIPGVGGGFEIMPNYKIDKNVFSTSDLSIILTGLSGLSEMMQSDELANALAKIKSFIPTEQAKAIELKTSQIHIDLSSWMGNKNIQSNLEIVNKALQEYKLFSFIYLDRYGNKTERTIEPYQLILKGNHWYVQGYCYQRTDFRLFKLSRLSSPQIQEVSFTPREYQKPQLNFTDRLATMQIELKIRIHKSIMDRVLDFCPYENFFPDGEEHYIVSFPFIENNFYYDILLSFGNKCECIEPEHIRTELKRRIHSIANIYEKDPK